MSADMWIGTVEGLHRAGSEAPEAFDGREVSDLVLESESLWGLVDGREIWRTQGGSWELYAEVADHRCRCILPRADHVLAGTARAHLVVARPDRVDAVAAFEQVDGRSEWFTPWGGPPDVRSLSASPSALFANVHVGGIPRSDDDGGSWRPTIDIHADVHQVVAIDGVVLAATARGLATSADAGESWSFDADGLHADYCRAAAVAGDSLLLSASVGPHGGRAALYRRPLDGAGFEKCTDGLPEWFGDNIDTHCLHASGTDAAFGTSDGSAFTSSDAGASWRRVATGLPAVRAVAVT
jgi:hypothetical protein